LFGCWADAETGGIRYVVRPRRTAPESLIAQLAATFEMILPQIAADDGGGGAQAVLHVAQPLELGEHLQARDERLRENRHDEECERRGDEHLDEGEARPCFPMEIFVCHHRHSVPFSKTAATPSRTTTV